MQPAQPSPAEWIAERGHGASTDAWAVGQAMGEKTMAWQIKGLLLLTSALAAITLAASTSGATAKVPAPAVAAPAPCSTTGPTPRPGGEILVTGWSGSWYHGRIDPA